MDLNKKIIKIINEVFYLKNKSIDLLCNIEDLYYNTKNFNL
jgi:hypothetical protein